MDMQNTHEPHDVFMGGVAGRRAGGEGKLAPILASPLLATTDNTRVLH